jgi:hypothetical protein
MSFHELMGRVGDFAVIDIAGTAVGGYLLAKYMNWNPFATVTGAFIVGEGVHYILKIDTPFLDKIDATLK